MRRKKRWRDGERKCGRCHMPLPGYWPEGQAHCELGYYEERPLPGGLVHLVWHKQKTDEDLEAP